MSKLGDLFRQEITKLGVLLRHKITKLVLVLSWGFFIQS